MSTLYELNGIFLQLQQLAEDGTDVTDTLEAVELSIEEKLEGYAMVIKNLQADTDGLKGEIERLTSRKRSLEANITRMKQAMADTLELIEPDAKGKKRFKSSKFTVSFRESTAVVVDDASLLPQEFVVVETKPNKKELAAYLKDGGEIMGATLQTSKSLQIR